MASKYEIHSMYIVSNIHTIYTYYIYTNIYIYTYIYTTYGNQGLYMQTNFVFLFL